MAELVEKISLENTHSDIPLIKDAKFSPNSSLKDRPDENNPDLDRLRETHQHEIEMLKYGKFGKIFGAEENSSKALTFTIILIIISVGLIIVIASIWVNDLMNKAIDFFKVILPIITLAFGYFFGKR